MRSRSARPGGRHIARGRRGGDPGPLPGAAHRGRLRRHLRAAIANHATWDNPFEEARTELRFGEPCAGPAAAARRASTCASAAATFERLAAEPWAARRGHRASRATGETVRRRDRSADEELDAQELLDTALHAAEGESNREIGAALFLSPRTVEFHLTRVFILQALTSIPGRQPTAASWPVRPGRAIDRRRSRTCLSHYERGRAHRSPYALLRHRVSRNPLGVRRQRHEPRRRGRVLRVPGYPVDAARRGRRLQRLRRPGCRVDDPRAPRERHAGERRRRCSETA